MDYERLKLPWRVSLFILAIFTQIRQQVANCIDLGFEFGCLSRNKYLSVQVIYLVIIWLGLFLYWRKDSDKIEKIEGEFHGAVTVYATIVWLAFWTLLSSQDSSTGWDAFTNLVIHYIIPIAFIIDWVIFERQQYQWKFYMHWAVYPLGYAVFAIINGLLDLSLGYIYGFLDPTGDSGWGGTITMIAIIYSLFSVLSIIFIGANRQLLADKAS